MKSSLSFIVCSWAVPTTVYAQVVQWGIAKREPQEPNLGRRQAQSIEEIITNDKTNGGYFATCKVGTPGQDVTLQLDTGSSDIWVPSSDSSVCVESRASKGCSLGSCKCLVPRISHPRNIYRHALTNTWLTNIQSSQQILHHS